MSTRREFFRDAGILMVATTVPASVFAATASTPFTGSLRNNPTLTTWLKLTKDGTVDVFTGKGEIGQGILTALAQIVAEELDVDIQRIRMQTVDTKLSPNEGITAGSMSVVMSGTALRLAAADAKRILLATAKSQLAATDLSVRDAQIFAGGNATGLDYWQILSRTNLDVSVSTSATPKPSSEHHVVGTSVPRVDIPKKVTGEFSFIQDLHFDRMLHARMVRTSIESARLVSIDTTGTLKLPGVLQVVVVGSFVAVVTEREEQAINAAANLAKTCQWQAVGSPIPNQREVDQWLRGAQAETTVVAANGQSQNKPTAKYLQADFTRHYQAHASLAPSAALALSEGPTQDPKLIVWSHAQGMFPLRGAIARILNMPEENVRCIHAQSSGCYGHNGADDAACDAAVIAARMPGRVIRLQYSRADEFYSEPFGPAMSLHLAAKLNAAGNIDDFHFDVWSNTHATRPVGARGAGNTLAARAMDSGIDTPPPFNLPQPAGGGDRNAVPLYDIPNYRITKHLVLDMPVRVSALRTLGGYTNVFAIESFMDELANKAQVDPLEFRLRHLADPRARAVIERVGRLSDWQKQDASGSHGRGIGFARYKNSACFCAVVAEVTLAKNSHSVQVVRVFAVADAGQVINPDGLRAQIEGGIIQAISWTLKERVTINHKSNEVLARDWASYPVLKFSEIPEMTIELIDQPNLPALGAGEASSGPAGAALGNAIANAGTRFHTLPML